ncbi:MAG: hypothetical protein QOK10_1207 [Pseudonocardiales bacterium]|jgi:hypothetical protein|nr:hypothetical protein [Pseudonocardiales bacterium]
MAKTVVMTDDIDGSANAETVTFSFDGANYEIDLSKKNRTALEKAVRPFLDAARRTSGRGPRAASTGRGRPRRSNSSVDLASVRAWAAENGIQVSSRGRISAAVMEQYRSAN